MSLTKYRKLPTEVDAIQWTGHNIQDIWDWGGAAGIYGPTEKNVDQLILTTVHGEDAIARIGDWVVREPVPDCFYPVKPDIFAATYEPVATPTEEPDFLAGTAACSLNPDDEGCESCQ